MIKSALLWLIKAYQYVLSPFLVPSCRFSPSCSHYANEAILKHGALYGGWLSLKRILRCNPWHSGGYDPVP